MANINTKKDEYIAKIIHDLKTPVNAQITALESFLETTSNKISQEEKDLIELTLNSCNYMQKLIDIFNAVHKLNYEAMKLNYEKFDVIQLIHSLIKEVKILTRYQKLNIDFEYNEALIINADKLQIKRVIENLLSNSINYAFKDSIIKISLFVQNNYLLFKIKNKSPYIESGILETIFQKYKTNASSYGINGVGLGLYLSKEIILAHHGTIEAKSYPDNVNIFQFKIPIN